MTTTQLACALAHIEQKAAIGMLECAWLAAIVASPGSTYNELAERYDIRRQDKPNGPGSRLRDKGLIVSEYDKYGKFRHYPTPFAKSTFSDAIKKQPIETTNQ